MRSALASLAAILWISGASAQEAMPEDGLGPYHFGMSLADTEATAPHSAWHVEDVRGVGQILSGGPRLALGDAGRFAAAFVLDQNALKWIILSGSGPSDCPTTATALLAQLEPIFGAFSAAPGPREEGNISAVSVTPGQSEIRTYTDGNGLQSAFSARRGGMFIQVVGEAQPNGAHGCNVLIVFNAAETQATTRAEVSDEELDHAQTLLHPPWIERPGARAFELHYPTDAIQHNIEGRTQLNCLIKPDGTLRCLVSSEEPADKGFGTAALAIAREFRARLDDGVVGKRVRVPITFRIR